MLFEQHDAADRPAIVSEHRTCDMKCAALNDGSPGIGDPPIGTSGQDLPAHMRIQTTPMRPALGDPTSQRLALLLSLHPEIDRQYEGVDLRKIGAARRRHMLELISRRLNIPSPV